MKKILWVTILISLVSIPAFSKTVTYLVEQNDQLGSILFSLGHKKLWAKSGKVNLFKRNFQINDTSKIFPGTKLKISEDDIVFKKNVVTVDDNITITRKINTLLEFAELVKNENLIEENIEDKPVDIQIEPLEKNAQQNAPGPIQDVSTPTEKTIRSFEFYPGVGIFLASNKEVDRQAVTTTFTGIQPLVEFKGIYSDNVFGSLSIDLFAKKIIQNVLHFPLNFDNRLQFVPKWNFTDFFRFAISHSTLTHSYAGKYSDSNIEYTLKSNFIGFGFVIPRDHYWFEFYLEKAYSGETTSLISSQKASKGIRLDTEWVYPVSEKLRIIPGLNYYSLNQESAQYQLKVFEARLILAREFEFL